MCAPTSIGARFEHVCVWFYVSGQSLEHVPAYMYPSPVRKHVCIPRMYPGSVRTSIQELAPGIVSHRSARFYCRILYPGIFGVCYTY